MGASLVGAAFARWTHVSDTAFRILVRMALTALDNPSTDGRKPAATYWGGRDLLAMSLRRPWPEGDDERSANARKNIHRDVRRALGELAKEGAIEVMDTGRAVRQGNRQVYRLCLLPGVQAGFSPPPQEGPTTPPEEGVIQHRGGGENPSQGRRGATEGAKKGEERADLRGPRSPSARARDADDQISTPRVPGPTCGTCFICRSA